MNLNELRQDASATLRIPQHISLAPARARRTYIAGPMTGYPDFNYPAFNAAAAQLRAAGIAAINPADHGVVPGAAWEDYLRSDLAQLATCESIYFLPGWSKSRGALLEHHIATSLGMQLFFAEGAEKPEPVRLRDELRERAEFEAWAQSIGTAIDADEHGNYLDGGLNYAKLGWQAALSATSKQQVGEVQEDALAALVADWETRYGVTDAYRICAGELKDALAARQPGAQTCTNCDRTDAKVICQTCAGLAWDTGRLHEFNEIRELSTSLGEGGMDELVPEEWNDKPLLRFQGAYDCGDDSAGVPARSGHVLAPDQTGTVLGDYLAARAAKEGGL